MLVLVNTCSNHQRMPAAAAIMLFKSVSRSSLDHAPTSSSFPSCNHVFWNDILSLKVDPTGKDGQ